MSVINTILKRIAFLLLIFTYFISSDAIANDFPVGEVKIHPVIFIPKGREILAAQDWQQPHKNIGSYLSVVQRKWYQMLGTAYQYEQPTIIYSNKTIEQHTATGDPSHSIQVEVLAYLGLDTSNGAATKPEICNLNKIIITLVLGGDSFGDGWGGNWCSQGLRNGPGAILVGIDHHYNRGKLTSTLVHEVGHSLGLTHIFERPSVQNPLSATETEYGKYTSDSVMSYNPDHHTNSIDIDDVKGSLTRLELFELSFNKRALPYHSFNSVLSSLEQTLLTSFRHRILDVESPYSFSNTWRSPVVNSMGWVSFGVTLPVDIYIDSIVVETGTSTTENIANKVQIEYKDYSGEYVFLTRVSGKSEKIRLPFTKLRAQEWKIALHTDVGGQIDLRGVRFFNGENEVYPPLY